MEGRCASIHHRKEICEGVVVEVVEEEEEEEKEEDAALHLFLELNHKRDMHTLLHI